MLLRRRISKPIDIQADVSHIRTSISPPALPTAGSNPNAKPTLLVTLSQHPVCADSGERDIGDYAKSTPDEEQATPETLQRDNTRILDEIHEVIGSKRVTAPQLTFAPPWIMQEALTSDHISIWKNVYVPVQDTDVPRDANLISSHVIYNLKTEETGKRFMKARIIPHGNHDDEKDDVRKDYGSY